jgi:transposase
MPNSLVQSVGVDIAKDTLDVHLHPTGRCRRFANDARGCAALIAWLEGFVIARVAFEPTGAYHHAFERRLAAAGLPLVKDRGAARNRDHTHRSPLLKRQAKERLRQIERQIAAVAAALHAHLALDPALRARFAILVSIPGVAGATAWAMLVEMPELGAIEPRCAASLAGLAPIARDSGRRRAKRCSRGGRARLRQALYLPALVAVRFNAAIKAKYQALLAAGKPPKVALVAIMPKLLILANAPIRDGRMWSPSPA